MDELRNSTEDLEGLVLSLPPRSASAGLLDDEAEGALEHARATEVLRFEELLEWFLAETENALSDARLLVSRLDGERKRITLMLANNRNT